MGKSYNMVGGGAGGGIKLQSISITAPPAKVSYLAGERFDPTGMVVTAAYSNGATLAATGYTVEPSGPLEDGMEAVTVRYTEGGVSAAASVAITVIHRLTGISIETPPAKTEYRAGEVFDPAGMVVLAAYSDGASEAVTGYTVPTEAFAAPGPQEVAVTYTEHGVTASASVAVTVARLVIEDIPRQSGSPTYTGEAITLELENYDPAQLTLGGVTSAVNAGEYAATATPTERWQWSDGTTGAKSIVWTIGKAAGSVNLSPASVTLDKDHLTAEIQVTRAGDGAVSAASSDTGVAAVSVSGTTVTVSSVGEASGSAVVTVSVAEGSNHLAANGTAAVTASFVMIYGVEWDWTDSGSSKGTRTDAAAFFTDPVPAVNNGTGSSPFDSIMPWAGMVKETRAGGVEVKEPKYWFKWTKTGKKLKLQIANSPVDGFHVDPVNMDRGDGLGELDFSYIGRYHCDSAYKSTTNAAQKSNITRSSARTGIHNLGAYFWQIDFAQFWYVGMLYLVEFADWNGQATIGRGCSAVPKREDNGKTDAMQYHTGTTATNRDTFGFTQYRDIEGWWDNVFDFIDGCYYNKNGLNVIKNPNQFNDNANGVLVGKPAVGTYPSDFAIPTQSGLEWALYPTAFAGSNITFVPDSWYFNGSYPGLRHGGSYRWDYVSGPFCISSQGASDVSTEFGCRLQERPPKAS